MNQKEIIYTGAISELKVILKSYGSKNIFLVRGKKSFNVCGAKAAIEKIAKKYSFTEYFDFSNNPKFEEAELGYEKLKKSNSDLLIAIGGGSVIDMAKLIKNFQIRADNAENLPFIAIPTTAGTGSEATCFAVVYKNGIKDSTENEKLLPDYVIIDSNLMQGQSEYQMAVSGIDAFSQAIESMWSVNSNPESLIYSEKAIHLIWFNLQKAIKGNKDALIAVAMGAHLAGKAINITKTTAPHALSYGFTSIFGLPHGHAVALFLTYFFYLHKRVDIDNCADERGIQYVIQTIKRISEIINVSFDDIELEIMKFIKCLGLIVNFEDLNITIDDYLLSISKLNYDRLKNNPVKVSQNNLTEIFYYNKN